MNKIHYVIQRIVNLPDNDVTYDVYIRRKEGYEFVAEFNKKEDAKLFVKIANAKISGKRMCIG